MLLIYRMSNYNQKGRKSGKIAVTQTYLQTTGIQPESRKQGTKTFKLCQHVAVRFRYRCHDNGLLQNVIVSFFYSSCKGKCEIEFHTVNLATYNVDTQSVKCPTWQLYFNLVHLC